MPIYEYECQKCHKVHEVWQKISDAPETTCPDQQCGGEVKKIMSNTSFSLKGTGWYTTDYKRSSSSSSSSGSSSSGSSSG